MSPDARAAATAIELLRHEVGLDVRAMRKHRAELVELLARWDEVRGQRPLLVVAAVELHAWYTALEAALERAVRTLDGHVPSGPDSHLELLKLASIPRTKVRPALVPAELFGELKELLKFRHFFRHAYRADLDPAKLEREVRRLAAVGDAVETSLEQLDAFLVSSLGELEER